MKEILFYLALLFLFLNFSIAKIYDPMAPYQKTNWIEELNRIQYYVD